MISLLTGIAVVVGILITVLASGSSSSRRTTKHRTVDWQPATSDYVRR